MKKVAFFLMSTLSVFLSSSAWSQSSTEKKLARDIDVWISLNQPENSEQLDRYDLDEIVTDLSLRMLQAPSEVFNTLILKLEALYTSGTSQMTSLEARQSMRLAIDHLYEKIYPKQIPIKHEGQALKIQSLIKTAAFSVAALYTFKILRTTGKVRIGTLGLSLQKAIAITSREFFLKPSTWITAVGFASTETLASSLVEYFQKERISVKEIHKETQRKLFKKQIADLTQLQEETAICVDSDAGLKLIADTKDLLDLPTELTLEKLALKNSIPAICVK